MTTTPTPPLAPGSVQRWRDSVTGSGLVACPPGTGGDYVGIVDYATLYARWLSLSLAEGAPVWIPCSERMPPPDTCVIATDGSWVGERMWDSGRYLKKPVAKWHDMRGHLHWGKTLTHWQPLPPPPAP